MYVYVTTHYCSFFEITFQLLTKQNTMTHDNAEKTFCHVCLAQAMCYKNVATKGVVVTTQGEVRRATWKHTTLLRFDADKSTDQVGLVLNYFFLTKIFVLEISGYNHDNPIQGTCLTARYLNDKIPNVQFKSKHAKSP